MINSTLQKWRHGVQNIFFFPLYKNFKLSQSDIVKQVFVQIADIAVHRILSLTLSWWSVNVSALRVLKSKVAQGKELQFLWIVNWRNEKLSNIENQWFQYEAMEAEDQNGRKVSKTKNISTKISTLFAANSNSRVKAVKITKVPL